MLIGSSNCNFAPRAASVRKRAGVRGHAQSVEIVHPGSSFVAQADHLPQLGKALRRERAGPAAVDLRHDIAQNREVIAGLEPRRQDERLASHLGERVFEFGAAIGRVDVDQDQSRPGGRELRQHPLGAVRRPDADSLACFKAEAQQPDREVVDAARELTPGPAHPLVPDDQRGALGITLRDAFEMLADRGAEQRNRRRTVDIARITWHRDRSATPDQGNANTKTLLPRLKSSCVLPPAATATYCLPRAM